GTLASASSTFMWPGSRPATGWMPKRTSIPFSRSRRVRSATGYWACATAMPYPGVMMTEDASTSSLAVSDAVISRYSPSSVEPDEAVTEPNPPAMTDRNDRFIALHITRDRYAPEEPTSAPVMMSRLLLSRKPAAAAAQPE